MNVKIQFHLGRHFPAVGSESYYYFRVLCVCACVYILATQAPSN